MIQSKDFLLLVIVTFMTVAFILPEDSIMRGLDRGYMLAGLLVVATIALAHHSKVAIVAAVLIATMGANLPEEIANILNVDARIFMVTLIAIVLVAMANHFFKLLPTGLDKPQGIPAGKGFVSPNPNIVELNVPENDEQELNTPENLNNPAI